MDYIKIQGYKSFKEQKVYLRKINLLIGSNGSGKSNFLSLFELLGNIYDGRLAQSVVQAGGVDKLLHQGRKETERIEICVVEGKNSYVLSLIESDGKLVVENERLGYNYNPRYHLNWSFTTISEFSPETSLKSYSGMRRGDYIRDYISQIRKFHFHDTGRKSPFTSDSDIRNDSYRMYANGDNLAAILYRIREEHPMAYKRIVRVINSVAPFFNDFYLEPTEAGKIRLQWQDKFSDMIYGPTDLSDGTIRFIALAVLFLQPRLPKIIIIDEPELGLHPVAIEKLAGLIKLAADRGAQIIAATQSAELISNFSPEDILTVDQREGHTTIKRLDGTSLEKWLEEYTIGDLWKQKIVKGGQPG